MPILDGLLPLAQVAPQRQWGSREIIDYLARTPLSVVVMIVAALTVLRIVFHPVIVKTPVHKRGAGYAGIRVVNEVLDAIIYSGVFVFLLIRPFGVQAFLIPSGSMWPTLYVNDFIVANKLVYRTRDPQNGEIVVFRPPVPATEGHPEQRDPNTGEVTVDFIKRCIGTPGQVIELRKGVLYRDGKPVEEPYKTLSRCTNRNQVGECLEFEKLSDIDADNFTKEDFKLVKYKGRLIPLNYTEYDANSRYPNYGLSTTPPYSISSEFEFTDQTEAKSLESLPAEPVPPGYYLMMGDNRNGSFDGRGWGLVPRKDIVGRSEVIWLPFSRIGKTK